MRKAVLYSALFLLILNAFGQSAHFTQYFNSGPFLNPSLTGIDVQKQATLLYRNHWPQLENSFITQAFIYESNIKRSTNGFAFSLLNDRAGAGNFSQNSINISYAHEISISQDWYLRSGIMGGYSIKSVDWDQLVFEDMIDPRNGVSYDSQQARGENIDHFDVSMGFTLFSEKHFLGFSVDHLTQPKGGLINQVGESVLKRAYAFQVGTQIGMGNQTSLTPVILFRKQGKHDVLQTGALMTIGSVQVGAWYGSEERLILSSGMNIRHFSFTYSYDLYSSKLLNQPLGSHELSMQYRFQKHHRKKNYRRQSCPKF
jgi:type IX secretion system PorP/SprF family membrane protein